MLHDDPIEGARHRLERAGSGLRYVSESDAPFSWVHFPGSNGDGLRAAAVARLVAAAEDEVEEWTVEQFFASQIEAVDRHDAAALARAGLFRVLRDMLHKEVHGVRVYRVGRKRLRCLLIGRLGDGSVGGLETEAVET